ncbi:hypothetical protein RKD18_000684 [Streptomyces phaeoluteigriseus]
MPLKSMMTAANTSQPLLCVFACRPGALAWVVMTGSSKLSGLPTEASPSGGPDTSNLTPVDFRRISAEARPVMPARSSAAKRPRRMSVAHGRHRTLAARLVVRRRTCSGNWALRTPAPRLRIRAVSLRPESHGSQLTSMCHGEDLPS